jgi:hypothetical protein
MTTEFEGLLTDTPQVALDDLLTARTMAETLHKHYPGHLWGVSCDWKQGVADVRNMGLSGNWGFRLVLAGPNGFYTHSDLEKQVMRAGGELLERFKQRRGAATEAIHHIPQDFAGRKQFIAD